MDDTDHMIILPPFPHPSPFTDITVQFMKSTTKRIMRVFRRNQKCQWEAESEHINFIKIHGGNLVVIFNMSNKRENPLVVISALVLSQIKSTITTEMGG